MLDELLSKNCISVQIWWPWGSQSITSAAKIFRVRWPHSNDVTSTLGGWPMDSTVSGGPAIQIWWLHPTHNWRYDNLSNSCDLDNLRYRFVSHKTTIMVSPAPWQKCHMDSSLKAVASVQIWGHVHAFFK